MAGDIHQLTSGDEQTIYIARATSSHVDTGSDTVRRMSTPDERKNIKVSAATHRAVYGQAAYGETADDVLSRIFGPDTVLFHLDGRQRERWTAAAAAGGMSLEEFIKARVEAALTFDADPTGLYVIHRQLEELFRRLPAPPAPRSQP